MALDRHEDVRWRALTLLGDYTDPCGLQAPQKLWPVVERLGASRSAGLRSGVACCVLEHLLEHHFDEYYPRVREKIEAGDRKMLEMLATCHPFGQAESHERQINAFIRRHGGTPPKRRRLTARDKRDLEELDRLHQRVQDQIADMIEQVKSAPRRSRR